MTSEFLNPPVAEHVRVGRVVTKALLILRHRDGCGERVSTDLIV